MGKEKEDCLDMAEEWLHSDIYSTRRTFQVIKALRKEVIRLRKGPSINKTKAVREVCDYLGWDPRHPEDGSDAGIIIDKVIKCLRKP